MFLSSSARTALVGLLIVASSGCSPSWTRSSLYPNRPSPAEDVLIREKSIHTPAGVDFDYATPTSSEEVCSEGLLNRFPLEVTVVPAQPQHRLSFEAQKKIAEKEKAELQRSLKDIYQHISYFPENQQKQADFIRKADIFVLEESVSEDTAIQKLKEARIPLPQSYANFAKTFFTFEDGFKLFFGQLQVQHITYETGKGTVQKPLSFVTYPKEKFYVVLDKVEKIPLKRRRLKGRALRRAVFLPLALLRRDYVLKIPPQEQKKIGLSLQGKEKKLPFGYGFKKNIDAEASFRPLVLLKQSEKLWNEILPLFTQVIPQPSNEQRVELYKTSLTLSTICKYAQPRIDVESQVLR